MNQICMLLVLSMTFLSVGCSDDEPNEESKGWYKPSFIDPAGEPAVVGAADDEPVAQASSDEPLQDSEDDVVLEFEIDEPGSVELNAAQANPNAAEERIITIQVRRGETVKLYERWSQIPLEELRALNEMSKRRNLRIGQNFKLLLSADGWRMFKEHRENHFTKLELSFFDKFDVTSLKKYTVQRGDNIWKIAQLHDNVPVWVLEKLNKTVNVAKLAVGDEIIIPVLQDLKEGAQSPAAQLWSDKRANTNIKATIQAQHQLAPQRIVAQKVPTAVPAPAPGLVVKVARNETLGHYARWGGVALKNIISANPKIDPNRISIGQAIRIPVSDSRLGKFYASRRRFNGTPPPKAFIEAQTAMDKAAKAQPASTKKVAASANVPKSSQLKDMAQKKVAAPERGAQVIADAAPTPHSPATTRKVTPKPRYKKHVVSKGDNAWKLATKTYGISLSQLRQANPNLNLDRLRVGAVLQIPIAQ